jgi:hypothetical protein
MRKTTHCSFGTVPPLPSFYFVIVHSVDMVGHVYTPSFVFFLYLHYGLMSRSYVVAFLYLGMISGSEMAKYKYSRQINT